jgi:hypothetical protein
MTRPIQPGDRVRHLTDPLEGVVTSVLVPERRGALAVVEVQVDRGGVERLVEGFWQVVPGFGVGVR